MCWIPQFDKTFRIQMKRQMLVILFVQKKMPKISDPLKDGKIKQPLGWLKCKADTRMQILLSILIQRKSVPSAPFSVKKKEKNKPARWKSFPLTASESSNPCRYKLSYMEEGESQRRFFSTKETKRSTCSGADGWRNQMRDKTCKQSLSPYEGSQQRRQSTPEQKTKQKNLHTKIKKKVICFSMLNWMLLPTRPACIGSHHQAIWLSRAAQQTKHFICRPSSNLTNQSLPPVWGRWQRQDAAFPLVGRGSSQLGWLWIRKRVRGRQGSLWPESIINQQAVQVWMREWELSLAQEKVNIHLQRRTFNSRQQLRDEGSIWMLSTCCSGTRGAFSLELLYF